jgi:hypothetical protein
MLYITNIKKGFFKMFNLPPIRTTIANNINLQHQMPTTPRVNRQTPRTPQAPIATQQNIHFGQQAQELDRLSPSTPPISEKR